jgi:hypothetical protein
MLKIILNAKENIMEFNENLQSKKKELPDIRRIKRELTQIENIIKKVNDLCKDEDGELNRLITGINFLQVEELKTKVEILQEVIVSNLPEEMEHDIEEDSMDEDVYKNIQLRLNGESGNILIREKNENLVVSVTVKSKNYYDFIVNDPLRVYNIISYINTNFNYE